MIAARKNAAFNLVLRRVLARALRRRFHAVWLAGREHLEALDPMRPVVGCVNHSNWWDGFVLYVLSDRVLPRRDIFLAMEEKNLRRYPFFRWMGCFGVDLDGGPRAALPGARYAVRLLAGDPRRLAWIFVQGKLLPPRVPVTAKPGALLLARRSGAQLLPLTIRYEWLVESRPSVFVRVGRPFVPDGDDGTMTTPEDVAAGLNDLLAATDTATDGLDFSGWEQVFAPGTSLNRRWDGFVHRLRGGGHKEFNRQNSGQRR